MPRLLARTTMRLVLFGGLGLALLRCGSSGESTFTEGDRSTCARLYGDACGRACADDAACAEGLFCGPAKTCTADCGPGVACEGFSRCERGRCVAPDFGGDPDGGGTSGDACIDLLVSLDKVEPTVVLLIDQSSSMNTAFGDAGSRWNVVRDVLMNPDGGVVRALEGDVAFGLALYTRVGSAPQGPAVCPRLIRVAPSLTSYGAMATTYFDAGPTGGTPTGQSIDKLLGFVDGGFVDGGLVSLVARGPKVIVLATDGEPDSCEDNDDPQGRNLTLRATERAFDAGIRTFAIAVGNQVGTDHLRQVANVGSGQNADAGDASAFSTNDRAQFVAAMNAIVFGVRSCVFSLGGAVAAGSETRGTVTLNGAPLTLGDPNGYRLNSPSELELVGNACTTLKTTEGNLVVRFPCGAFLPR